MSGQDRPRSRGRFVKDIATDERAARAAELRSQGWSYQRIADELGCADKGHAYQLVQRARDHILRGPAEELIKTEATQLDELYAHALDILDRDHVLVSQGRVVYGDDGQPLLDDGPKLAALRELRQIRESFRRLYGLDQPSQVAVSGAVRYEVVGVDAADLT